MPRGVGCVVFFLGSACAGLLAAVPFANPAQADIFVAINKSSQRMTVMVNGREQYRWPVSTGLGGGPPSGTYQPERMERTWHSRKLQLVADAALDLLPQGLRHPRHALCVAARQPRVARLRAAASAHAATLFALVQQQGMGRTTIVVSGSARFAGRT